MRISDWSSDVCSSDLREIIVVAADDQRLESLLVDLGGFLDHGDDVGVDRIHLGMQLKAGDAVADVPQAGAAVGCDRLLAALLVGQRPGRSEEHTSELQSLMRISSAVFCLKKKIK